MDITVTDDHDPPFALCSVEASNNPDPAGRREEHILFGRISLEDCFWRVAQYYPEIDMPQPVLLLATKFIARSLNGGRRDEALESDITVAWLRHHGLIGMEGLFARFKDRRPDVRPADGS